MTRNSRYRPTTKPIKEQPASDLIIRQRCEAMIEYAYVAIGHFPKSEKPGLGLELRQTCWRLLRLIIIANKRHHKKTTMADLDAELDLLRSQVRLGHMLGHIPPKRYEHWARLNDEIGRLLGGWIRSQQPDAGAAR